MRHRILRVLAVTALFTCATNGTVSAATIFSDGFSGSSLDPFKWTTETIGTGSVNVSGSDLNLWGGSMAAGVRSTAAYSASQGYMYTFTLGATAFTGVNNAFGFANDIAASAPRILLRNDIGGDQGRWRFDIGVDQNNYFRDMGKDFSLNPGDKVSFEWKPRTVNLYQNGHLVYNYSNSAYIPTGPQNIQMSSWLGGGAHFDAVNIISLPSLTKLPGVLSANAMETTPFIWKGEQYLFESYRGTTTSPSPQYLAIRNLTTGQETAPFGNGYSLGSAFVNGDQINVYATNGGIYRFTSTDMVNWTQSLAISPSGGEGLFNSSVCQDPQGYLMAYETTDPVSFSFKFARSTNLADWTKLSSVPTFAGRSGSEYSACPTIRYSDNYYYAMFLSVGHDQYTGQFITEIARSTDLTAWEWAEKNPVLTADPDEGINASDVDLFEWQGKTYLFYADGDQQTWLELKRAVYDGPMSEFLASHFPPFEQTPEPASCALVGTGFCVMLGKKALTRWIHALRRHRCNR